MRRTVLTRVFALALFGALACSACERRDRLAEARTLQETGDLYASLEPLRELIAESPDDPEVHFLYGGALSALGHVSQGEFSLEKAMEDPKWRVRAGVQIALGALKTADYPRAIEVAGRVLETEPDHVGALLIRSEARARQHKELDLALADAERAISLEPDRLDAEKPRILALLALGRIPEAEAAIAELGRRLGGSDWGADLAGWHCATEAVFTEEKALYEEDQAAGARAKELWRGCLERFPSDPDVVEHALEFYDQQGDAERSIEVLRGALAKEPTADVYRPELAQRLRNAGKLEDAEAVLREAADAPEPVRSVIAGLELAEHYQTLGEYTKSLEVADRAMQRSGELGGPVPSQILFEYADALLLANELDRAEALTKQMTVDAHRELVLARVAQERGNYRRAARHYDEAFRLWPDNGDARFTAAVAAEANGDFARAIEQYRYAIRIQAGDVEARTRLARLHLAEGKPGLALEMLEGPPLPPDSDADLLALRLRVQQGEITGKGLKSTLEKRSTQQPEQIARALASVAQGLAARGEAAGALRLLREQKRVSLRDPGAAPALRAFVAIAREARDRSAAVALAREAVAEHPDLASAHEVFGRALEASGAKEDQVRAAYARAVELDAKNAGALLGLGRIALAHDASEALALFDRAGAASTDDTEVAEAALGAARALVKASRGPDAEARLGAALPEHPLVGALAGELADLRIARSEFSDETLALARRAVRFGGGAAAWERLAHVHEGRGDDAKAAEARASAREKKPERKADASAEVGR